MDTKGLLISQKKSDGNMVSFTEIFNLIPDGDRLIWSILSLHPRGLHLKNKSVDQFRNEIDECLNGYILSWKELNELGSKIHQIIDGVFVGVTNLDNLNVNGTEKEMYESSEYVINMFDTSYLIIYTKNKVFFENLKSNFKILRYLEVNDEL